MMRALDAVRDEAHPDDTAVLSSRVHELVAASPATLCLVSTDDLAGMIERPNHPGTTNDQQPNWQRRLPVDSEALLHGEPGSRIIAAIVQHR
jgi:4-alpha-glucanotransferase